MNGDFDQESKGYQVALDEISHIIEGNTLFLLKNLLDIPSSFKQNKNLRLCRKELKGYLNKIKQIKSDFNDKISTLKDKEDREDLKKSYNILMKQIKSNIEKFRFQYLLDAKNKQKLLNPGIKREFQKT
jgi:hypothetical protein